MKTIRRTETQALRSLGALALVCSLLAVSGCKKGVSPESGAPAAAAGVAPAPAGGNLLKTSNFDDGKSLPWMASFSAPAAGKAYVENGAYCVDVDNVGTNRWDAQVRHREMTIQSGHTYTIQFKAWASKPTKAYPKVGMAGPPYSEYFGRLIDIGVTPQIYQAKFAVGTDDDPTAEMAFHLGAGLAKSGAPLKVCFDDMYLTDTQYTPPPAEAVAVAPDVRVNQTGYLPQLSKFASIKNAATQPLPFDVLDAAGKSVMQGQTVVHGNDPMSGDHLHIADFSAVRAPGKGYVVKVGDASSDPFDISKDVYSQLKYDALTYFYQNRSGIEIKMPFSREEKWARPAGHKPDVAQCTPAAMLKKAGWDPKLACDYELDVTGGWYDAGDHGKYVVNGGISVWTMLNQYERAKAKGTLAAVGDRKLNIPESGNGVADILDEARWQMEFMLRMQVPDGKEHAGMVHHKMHDEAWTALGLPPHEDKMPRYLRPPSTAATLNLAATGAQCARTWKTIDAKFASRCLAAAEKAWSAAEKFPNIYAPEDSADGGGPYNDADVTDEFYWAAAELFTTTSKPAYSAALTKSPYHQRFKGEPGGKMSLMSWETTDSLGVITLLTAKNSLPPAAKDALKARILAAGDSFLKVIDEQGYRLPFAPTGSEYPWGSNSFVLNNMMVLAVAFDLSQDAKYLGGVGDGMDYLLGRNAMGQSYVTGYGERPLLNPHHRFWAHQISDKFPVAPPGCVSGGPNSGLQDPYVQAAGLSGCKPQKCFLDHIEAWSTNEITINWNAPLAWTAAFLDEQGKK